METGSITQKIKALRLAAKQAEEDEWNEMLKKFDQCSLESLHLENVISFVISEIFKICATESS
jgi:hypothetical protein